MKAIMDAKVGSVHVLVWFGLVWFGLVWFGLVWFGLVWFGLFCFVLFCFVLLCFALFLISHNTDIVRSVASLVIMETTLLRCIALQFIETKTYAMYVT